MVREVVDLAEFKQLCQEKTVIADFYATWCPPCKMIAPKFQELATQFGNSVVEFIKVNVDEAAAIAQSEGISAMPTFRAYKNGQKVGEVVGANLVALQSMIEYHK